VNLNFSTVGGRKFVMTMGCGMATTLLQAFDKLDSDGTTYALVIIGTVGAYITGNVAQKKAVKDDPPDR
jgi:hypothetical protein